MVRRRQFRLGKNVEAPLFRLFADALDQIVWIVRGVPERIVFISSAFNKVFGIHPEELYDFPNLWLDCIIPEDRQRVEKAFADWVGGRAPVYNVEYRIHRRTDGALRWISARGAVVTAPGSKDPVGIFGGVAEDVTARKSLEEESVELTRRLERAVTFRDEFISLASHELRTPLVPLKLSLQTMNRMMSRPEEAALRVTGGPEFSRLLSVAMEQVLRLEVLTNNLLDASAVRAGKLEVHRTETDLSELLEGIVSAHRHWVETAGSTLQVRLQSQVTGEFDRMRIEQIIVNLISNALKYASGTLIEIDLEQLDGTARLRVRDHGAGIPENLMARLFERFMRGNGNQGKQGIGLGLFLSRQIAEAHGGRLSARNAPDGGAVFELIVPVRERIALPAA